MFDSFLLTSFHDNDLVPCYPQKLIVFKNVTINSCFKIYLKSFNLWTFFMGSKTNHSFCGQWEPFLVSPESFAPDPGGFWQLLCHLIFPDKPGSSCTFPASDLELAIFIRSLCFVSFYFLFLK